MRADLYEDLYVTEEVHWWHRAKRAIVKRLIQAYAVKHPDILDVGCGTGKNMEEFMKVGRVAGIDVSPEAIAFCKKRGLKSVLIGDATHMPFAPGKLDVVVALDVIEHVDEDGAVGEMRRILKPGGILIVTVPAFSWLWSQWDVVLHHRKRYTASSLQDVLTRNGFEIRKISYLYSFLVVPALIIRTFKQRFVRNDRYESDFQINNRFINFFFFVLATLEQKIVARYHMPFGTSVICVAQKKQSRG